MSTTEPTMSEEEFDEIVRKARVQHRQHRVAKTLELTRRMTELQSAIASVIDAYMHAGRSPKEATSSQTMQLLLEERDLVSRHIADLDRAFSPEGARKAREDLKQKFPELYAHDDRKRTP